MVMFTDRAATITNLIFQSFNFVLPHNAAARY